MKTKDEGEIWLNPGEIGWGGERVRIKTVLGSCVSLCFWHPHLRVGGMAHYMLPDRMHGVPGEDGRYASEAYEVMLRQMKQLHTRPQEYMTKLFGGASVLAGLNPPDAQVSAQRARAASVDVGLRNIEAAHGLVQARNLNLISSDLGGNVYRRVIFDLSNGDVWLQRLPLVQEKRKEARK
jgi:chemotaxis protein CheD